MLIAQETEKMAGLVREFGFDRAFAIIMACLLVGFFVAFGGFLSWLAYKYIPVMVEAFRHYMHVTAECARDNRDCNARLTTAVEGVNSNMAFKMDSKGDPRFRDHVFSTYRTNNALRHLCEASRVIAQGKPEEALPHINSAHEELSK